MELVDSLVLSSSAELETSVSAVVGVIVFGSGGSLHNACKLVISHCNVELISYDFKRKRKVGANVSVDVTLNDADMRHWTW